jgi:8-oxo-dGTP pyrophosphatase MutT (NUDIX family)
MKLVKQITASTLKAFAPFMSGGPDGEAPIQTGALPWRLAQNKSIEVLLVTGRRSGRWTIPKGWPMPGKTLAEAAAQEAFEEAGVRGTVDPKPIGTIRHLKQRVIAGKLEVNVVVHRLCVDRELPNWPELGQRKRKWFSAKDAATSVDSPELRDLIRRSVKRAPRR